jgi:hypothetical protein
VFPPQKTLIVPCWFRLIAELFKEYIRAVFIPTVGSNPKLPGFENKPEMRHSCRLGDNRNGDRSIEITSASRNGKDLRAKRVNDDGWFFEIAIS